MEKIKQLAYELLNRPAVMFHVMDCASGKYIPGAKKINQDFLEKNHQGDISRYLNTLKEAGYSEIQVIPRLSNGTGDKPYKPAITINFNSSSETKPQMKTSPQTPQQSGLGYAELAQGYAAQEFLKDLRNRHDVLVSKNTTTEKELQDANRKIYDLEKDDAIKAIEIKRLEKKVEKLKNKEPSALNKMAQGLGSPDGISAAMTALPQIIAMFKGSAVAPSEQPQPQAQAQTELTEWQKTILSVLETCPDVMCEKIYKVIVKLSENDQEFLTKLNTLLEASNLQKVN